MLGIDQCHACVDQALLRIKNVKGGALAKLRLSTHAVDRLFGCCDLCGGVLDIGFGGILLRPGLHDLLTGLRADLLKRYALLSQGFFRLTNERIFGRPAGTCRLWQSSQLSNVQKAGF